MKNRLILFLSLFTFGTGHAQVKDISFTISPVGDYLFFDKKAGLNDAFSAGGKIGFGFGEFLELRAVYMQSIGLETNFDAYGLANFNSTLFKSQSVSLKRYGGEIKVNLSSRRFFPYLTLGSGVQKIALKNQEDLSQIYLNTGLGIKTKLTDRIVFTVEGKYHRYNFNAPENLLTPENTIAFDLANNPTKSSSLNNFMLQTSLQFYLGGRKPGEASSLDSTYAYQFKNGLKGTQLIFEPSLNYIAFDKKSSFRDTYLLGLYAGMDFNSYIGIRAFYFRGMANEKISFDFEPFDLYGIELRARLNDANGVTPYIILGGGFMNVTKSYEGINNLVAKNQEFAQGGLGLNIPLGKRILISGGVRAMITSGSNVQDLATTDELQTHLMYNAGIKLSLGRSSKKATSSRTSFSEDVMMPKDFEIKSFDNTDDRTLSQKTLALKIAYETELQQVNSDLKKDTNTGNLNNAVQLLERKRTLENALYEVNTIHSKLKNNAAKTENIQTNSTNAPEKLIPEKVAQEPTQDTLSNEAPTEYLKLTPAEFESLIDTVLQAKSNKTTQAEETEMLKKRIDTLEKALQQKEKAKNVKPTK